MTIRESSSYVEVLAVGDRNTLAATYAEALTVGDRNALAGTYAEVLIGPPDDLSLVGKINKFAKRMRLEVRSIRAALAAESTARQAADNAMVPKLVPSGGTSGQVLKKAGADDYQLYWGTDNAGSGGGGSSIDDRRYVPAADEVSIDEFNDKNLDAAWVRVDGVGAPSAYVAWIEDAEQLMAQHTVAADSASAIHAILRPMTAMAVNDAFVTAFTLYGHPTASYVMGGLVLANGTTYGAGKQLVNLNYTGAGSDLASDIRSFQNFNSELGNGAATVMPGAGILNYTRLVKTGATTYRVDYSPNGVAWVLGTNYTWAETPTHVGLYCSNWGQARGGVAAFEFLRRVANVGVYTIPATVTRTWSSDGTNGVLSTITSPATQFAVSQSSTYSTLTADRAIDGVTTLESHTTNSGSGQWWQIDFGATRRMTLTRYGICGRNESVHLPRNFSLQGSQDASTWTTLHSEASTGPGQNTWYSAAVSDTTAWRYVRLIQTGNNSSSDTYLVLGEVEFWGTLSTV